MSHYGLHRPTNSGNSQKDTGTASNLGAFGNKNARVYAGTPNYGRPVGGTNSLTRFTTTPGSTADIYKPTNNSRIPTTSKSPASSVSNGYTSDYGKSGYTSDYGKSKGHYGSSYTPSPIIDHKSGYTSDYGRSGYVSDYTKPGYTSDRGRSGYVSSGTTPTSKYASTYANHRQDNELSSRSPSASSRNSYGTYSRSVSREDPKPYRTSIPTTSSVSPYPSTRSMASTGTSSKTISKDTTKPSNSRTTNTASPKFNYVKNYNRPTSSKSTYTRPQSYSYSSGRNSNSAASYVPKKPEAVQVPLSKSESKTKNVAKVPADFTSESESDSEEDSDSPNEDVLVLISRATSPNPEVKPKSKDAKVAEKISSTFKYKNPDGRPKVIAPRRSTAVQVNVKELEARSPLPDATVTRRYGMGHPSRPSSIYFDKYYSKYAAPSSRSYYPLSSGKSPTSPTSHFVSKIEKKEDAVLKDATPTKSELREPSVSPVQSKPPTLSSPKLLTVDMDGAPFSRDASPNDRDGDTDHTADESGVKKDYRKSILNMNLDERGKEEYQRRQEEMRASERRARKAEGHRRNSQSSLEDGESTLTRSSSKKKMMDLNRTNSKSRIADASRNSLHKSGSHAKVSNEDIRRRRGSRDDISSRSSSADLLENNRARDSSTSSEEESVGKVNRVRPRRRRKGSKEDVLVQDKSEDKPYSRSHSNEEKNMPGKNANSSKTSLNHSFESMDSLPLPKNAKPPTSPKIPRRDVTESETSCDEYEAEDSMVSSGAEGMTPPIGFSFPKFPTISVVEQADTSAIESSDKSDDSDASCSSFGLQLPNGNSSHVQKSATVIHVKETAVATVKTSSSSEVSSEEETERIKSPYDNVKVDPIKEDAFVKEPSPRDSGFSEPLHGQNDNDQLEDKQPEKTDDASGKRRSSNTERFIGKCRDIDSILNGGDEAKTFEELEVEFQREQPVKPRVQPIQVIPATSDEDESEAEKTIQGSKDQARKQLSLFIGKCKDIDEMLGTVSPSSPRFGFPTGPIEDDDDDPLGLKKIGQRIEEDDNSDSTTSSAVEEVEASDVRVHEAAKLLKSNVEEYTEEIDSSAVRIRESRAMNPHLQERTEEIDSERVRIREAPKMKGEILKSPKVKLDDSALQIYKYHDAEGDYGNYLDLESTIDEQTEEFDGFSQHRKNAIVLRTQLSVRVHAIIEKLLNSTGRELRRALFSLKQIFQDDKDLVHEFVQNDGLACLIKVGSEADQNYQNYILRALGQVMLYVDGMNGVIAHNETIQWLYSLVASKYRLVVKTALKLLLVFVEYTESNSILLIKAVNTVEKAMLGFTPWSNITNLLNEKDSADMELLVYAVTLINKTLNGIPEQDMYYDIVDSLEEQGMERIIQYYMSKQGTDLDLLQQFQIYEAVLRHEDGDDEGKPLPMDARLRQIPRSRRTSMDENERRKSRRHSVGSMPSSQFKPRVNILPETPEEPLNSTWPPRDSNHNEQIIKPPDPGKMANHLSGNSHPETNGIPVNGITPALRRRRERDARNRSLIKEQEEGKGVAYTSTPTSPTSPEPLCNGEQNGHPLSLERHTPSLVIRQRSRFENRVEEQNRKNEQMSRVADEQKTPTRNNLVQQPTSPNSLPKQNGDVSPSMYGRNDLNKKSWMLSMMYGKSQEEPTSPPVVQPTSPIDNNRNWAPTMKPKEEEVVVRPTQLRKEGSIKDMREKLLYKQDNNLRSPTSESRPRIGETQGIVNRAKEGLAASQRPESGRPGLVHQLSGGNLADSKKPENDLQWEQLLKTIDRALIINDLDFRDLDDSDDTNVFHTALPPGFNNYHQQNPVILPGMGPPPPPPPPGMGGPPPPPPPPFMNGPPPPPPPMSFRPPPPMNGFGPPPPPPFLNKANAPPQGPPWTQKNNQIQQPLQYQTKTIPKNKKTVKLFWREVKDDGAMTPVVGKVKTIWDEITPIHVDTQKLEHLFESRAKDIMNKKSQDGSKKHEVVVLDPKRSNAINIGMTKLPPPRTIKTAILKMDSTIMNREGIEKILTLMMPTEEEKTKIMEAQITNPEVPLGSAEQCLLTLASINELEARLRLWAFRLDYDTVEKEVAEPLMDLKQAIVEIQTNQTFRAILSTLLSVGNFLNGVEARGFQIDYLSKVPEVKDTVHKHSLLHHLCHIVMEKFPKSSDLYSEMGAVTRASRVDFDEVAKNLAKMESECKASWDYLKAIAKHDGSTSMKNRMSEFLADCAERIIVLGIIHRRVINRFQKLMVFLGCSLFQLRDLKVQLICKVVSEFALEYRTTRERVLQQLEKKANHRERNKTRGKMITDVRIENTNGQMDKFRTKEQQADHELRQLLGNGTSDVEDTKYQKWGTLPGMKSRQKAHHGSMSTLGRYNNIQNNYESMTDGDDEILESLVKTATTQPLRNEPRIRKKARYGDRKSLRRTLKSGLDLSEEERMMLAAMSS